MKILAASDLSSHADEAIRQGAEWATSVGAELTICYVLAAAAPSSQRDALAGELSKRVVDLTGRASAQFRIEIEGGTASSAIRRKAEQLGANLIVVGHRGAAESHRLRMGSVSRHVVERAHCSVLVARPYVRSGEVLAATDLSDPSLPAITVGASEASRRRANLTVLHNFDIWSASIAPKDWWLGAAGVPVSPESANELLNARAAQVRDQVERLGIQALTVVTRDLPEAAILAAAKRLRAELIVIGTHGRTGLARLALGSVAGVVLEDATCSVLVVRLA